MAGKLAPQPAAGEVGELALLADVGLPQVVAGNAFEPVPEPSTGRPGVEIVEVGTEVFEQLGDRLADPRRSMDAVGDALDRVVDDVGPRLVRCLGMQPADRVGAVGEAKRERGHVELVLVTIDTETEGEDTLDRDVATIEDGAGDAPDEIGIEAFVAGRHGRVDREHAVALHRPPGVIESLSARDQLASALSEQERRVALVQVPDRRREPESPDCADATDAEDELLVEPHLPATHVQDVGDRLVELGVLGEVGVEQKDRDAADVGDPYGHGEIAARELDGDRQRQSRRILDALERESCQVVVGVLVLLVAVGIDGLAEIALAVQQADADRGHRHVAGRLHVVAGEDAQTARVDAHRLVEAVFGAEVGDRAPERVGVTTLEPVVGAVRHVLVELGEDVVVLGEELGVIEQSGPVRRAADDGDRVPIADPGGPVDQAEQAPGSGMPRPVEVVGEPPQSLEPRWQGEARGRDRGDAHRIHEAPL